MKNLFFKKKSSLNQKKRKLTQQPGLFHEQRAFVAFVFFLVCFFALFLRASYVQLFTHSENKLKKLAANQYHSKESLSPYRGKILDRKGEPLAISKKAPSLFINPRVFSPTKEEKRKIESLLEISSDNLKGLMQKDAYFAWLKRKTDEETAKKVMDLELEGLHVVSEETRSYPKKNVSGNLLGLVGMDGHGLFGIEKKFDTFLSSENLSLAMTKDARNRILILNPEESKPEKPGVNIVLTIDHIIQEFAEEALSRGAKKARASAAYAIVADPYSGKILALANYPSFDLSNSLLKPTPQLTRNRALSDTFEPGSVVKPFLVAEALEKNRIRKDDVFYCENGLLNAGSFRIRDTHPQKDLSVTEVLVESSNICSYKIAQKLGKDELYLAFKNFGLAEIDSSHLLNFPGEVKGYLSASASWKPARFANVAFGQGFVVTGRDLVRAYSILANGGTDVRLKLIDHFEDEQGRRIKDPLEEDSSVDGKTVISKAVSRTIKDMLVQVVERGSGKKAQVPGYFVAGKTGTSEKVDSATKAYSKDKRIASFAGFAPAQNPSVVIYVWVDEPKEKPYFGGLWAAPIFSEIAEKTLKYLNISPTKLKKEDTLSLRSEEEEKANIYENESVIF